MALGGVLMGNMKAQLAAMVTGTAKAKGAWPRPTATEATTGTKTCTKARLLISSVRNKATVVRMRMIQI